MGRGDEKSKEKRAKKKTKKENRSDSHKIHANHILQLSQHLS